MATQDPEQLRSPFSCRWIESGLPHGVEVSNWTKALCRRTPNEPRVVTLEECRTCPRWQGRLTADAR